MPGPPNAFVSSISHDDAASAVAAAIGLAPGSTTWSTMRRVTHREFFDLLAETIGVSVPTAAAALAHAALRLDRKDGRAFAEDLEPKLRDASGWVPKYPSVRQGWPSVVGEIPPQPFGLQFRPSR